MLVKSWSRVQIVYNKDMQETKNMVVAVVVVVAAPNVDDESFD